MARPDDYDASECDTQQKGAPKFCKKSEPGEGTERSCAFDGARVVLMPITDAIHLVHGPIACAGNSWDNRGARSSGSPTLPARLHHRNAPKRRGVRREAKASQRHPRTGRALRQEARPSSSTPPASPR